MKKVTPLLFALGFFALHSCKKQEASSALNINADALQNQNLQVLSAFGVEPETFTPPTRTRGTTVLNVQDFGATGGNTTDDTQAFQDAIDALPADGGTVWVPAGTYYIKGDFKAAPGTDTLAGNSIRLRSNMHLKLSPYAHLKQIPTSAYAGYVVYAYGLSNVEISGGEIIGERDQHTGADTEGQRGIEIKGCDGVTIRDIKLSNFWGDGISMGTTSAMYGPKVRSNDVVIDNIISTGNRRQGLSIGPSTNVQVWDSEFSETEGTAPQCGIDIEPEEGLYVDDALIQNCIFTNNHAYGILLWKRTRNTTIKHCEMSGNQNGIVSEATFNGYLAFNEIHNNSGYGVILRDSTDDFTIVQNLFYQNRGIPARDSTVQIYGMTSETEKEIWIKPGATNITVYNNTYK